MSLNSKKSWHPSKAINLAKVAKKEQDGTEQQSIIESDRQELAAQQDIIDLRQQATGKPSKDAHGSKVPWMYADIPKVSSTKAPVDDKNINPKPTDAIDSPAPRAARSPILDTASIGNSLIDPRKLDLINEADPFAQILKNRQSKSRTDKRITNPKRKKSKGNQ